MIRWEQAPATAVSSPVGSCDALGRYLSEIAWRPLLPKSEERALGQLIAAGAAAAQRLADDAELFPADRAELRTVVADGDQAKRTLFEANLRLVVAIARSFVRSGLPLEDLVQEGNIGLLRAVDRFDHRKGFAFSTYASWWIRQSIQAFVATDAGLIRWSVRASANASKVRASRERLARDLGRLPTVAEIADDIGVSTRLVAEVDRYATVTGSIDDDRNGASRGLRDVVPASPSTDPAAVVMQTARQAMIADALDRLTPRSRQILRLRFGLDGIEAMPRSEIGRQLGVSRVRVGQLEAQAIKTLAAGGRSMHELISA